MFSQRGVLNLAHGVHDLQEIKRRLHANRLNGVDSEFLTPAQINASSPCSITSTQRPLPDCRRLAAATRRHGAPRCGRLGLCPRRRRFGGRHHPELRGDRDRDQGGKVEGVATTRGPIRCAKLALVAAGHSSVLAQMTDFRLPIESFPLQALVSEPVKPCLNTVIMSNAVHGYISQSDKGELVIGAGTDQFNAYSQRGIPPDRAYALRRSSRCFRRSRA